MEAEVYGAMLTSQEKEAMSSYWEESLGEFGISLRNDDVKAVKARIDAIKSPEERKNFAQLFLGDVQSAEMAKLLIDHGADPYKTVGYQQPAIHGMAVSGAHEAVEYMLSNYHDTVHMENWLGHTAFYTVGGNLVSDDHPSAENIKKTLALLKKHGANVNHHHNGWTLLHNKSSPHSGIGEDNFRFLLELGIDPNFQVGMGPTALQIAAYNLYSNKDPDEQPGAQPLAIILLEYGANALARVIQLDGNGGGEDVTTALTPKHLKVPEYVKAIEKGKQRQAQNEAKGLLSSVGVSDATSSKQTADVVESLSHPGRER